MRSLAVAIVLAGCGRSGFDPLADAPIDPSLIAWLPLDDDPATVTMFHDATEHGHDASCMPECPTRVPGRTTGTFATHFGAQGLVVDPSGLDLVAPYTLALWALVDAPPSDFFNFIGRPYGSVHEDSYALDITTPGVAEFFTPTQQHLTASAVLPVETWVHIAGTYDGTTKRLYVDGALAAAMESPASPYDAHPLYIGVDDDDGTLDGFLLGSLSDVRIYGRQLSDAEVAALAQR